MSPPDLTKVIDQKLFAGLQLCMEARPMLIKRFVFAGLLLAGPAFSQNSPPASTPAISPSASAANPSAPAGASSQFQDEKSKLSYSVGVDIGRTLTRLQLDLNQDALTQGLTDVLTKKPLAMTDQELQQTLQNFQQQMVQKQQAAMAKKQEDMKANAGKNKTEGQKFLTDNAKKPGVKTLPSGLQYKVIKQGTGDKPKDTDIVEVNYRGTLINGKEFDSSEKNGGPVSLPVNGVIQGWSEALKLMPVGSKWEIYVPSDLAYKDEGAGEDIAPGSTLVFDVELLGIKKTAGTAPAGTAPQSQQTASPSPSAASESTPPGAKGTNP
jgi:FKBP-type peptidyl-prolyl cis-trans isomerase